MTSRRLIIAKETVENIKSKIEELNKALSSEREEREKEKSKLEYQINEKGNEVKVLTQEKSDLERHNNRISWQCDGPGGHMERLTIYYDHFGDLPDLNNPQHDDEEEDGSDGRTPNFDHIYSGRIDDRGF